MATKKKTRGKKFLDKLLGRTKIGAGPQKITKALKKANKRKK